MIDNMNKNSVCIFAESGEYVKFHNLLSISMAAVANDMEVSIFFSYSALERLKKDNIKEKIFSYFTYQKFPKNSKLHLY